MAVAQREPVLTGGCQCGAIRYALYGEPISADICHCRMCQKALGNAIAPFAGVALRDFAWTKAERGFCRDCGTPLSIRDVEGDKISVTIGSLDQPERVRPTSQSGIEARLPWLAEALALPGSRTEDDRDPAAEFPCRTPPRRGAACRFSGHVATAGGEVRPT